MHRSKLAKRLEELLSFSVSHSTRFELLEKTEEDLNRSLQKYRDLYSQLSSHSGKMITQNLERAFAEYQRQVDNFRERLSVTQGYEDRLQDLLYALQALKGAQFDFREELWQSSGPSTHPGVNELISHINSRDDDALADALVKELERLDAQEKLLDKQPDFLRRFLRDLFQELRALLDEVAELLEEEEPWEDLGEIKSELWEWGLDYSSHDVEGLYKKCCTAPTNLPWVNFALNARRLYLEDFLSREFADYITELAIKELQKFSKWIVSEQARLDDHHVQEYLKLSTEVEQMLIAFRRVKNVQEVQMLGSAFIPPVSKLHGLRLRCS